MPYNQACAAYNLGGYTRGLIAALRLYLLMSVGTESIARYRMMQAVVLLVAPGHTG